jgi:hypothetical protein
MRQLIRSAGASNVELLAMPAQSVFQRVRIRACLKPGQDISSILSKEPLINLNISVIARAIYMEEYHRLPTPRMASLARLAGCPPDRIYRPPCSPSEPLDSFLAFLAAFFSFGVRSAFFFSSLLGFRSFDMMFLQIIYW